MRKDDGDFSSEERQSAREHLERIKEAKHRMSDDGRPEAVEQMHEQGALTARERVDYLCDEDSFDEIGQLAAPGSSTPETADWTREDAPADGLITGIGTIDGRPAAVCSFDFTVKGGSIGHTGFVKLRRILDLAMDNGFPAVLLHEGGGHRIQEGLDAKPIAHGDFREPFETLAKLSGYVPTISAVMGTGFAGPTNFASVCDYVPIVDERSMMGIAGPPIVKAALGIDISKEDYDSEFHTAKTGIAHRSYPSDEACLDSISRYLSYFPRNATRDPPRTGCIVPREEEIERLLDIVPANPKKAYDAHDVIRGVVDRNSLFEYQPKFAKNVLVGFARIDGYSVGVVANNPRYKAGTIDVDATNKAPRFISLCDAYDIPIVLFVDVPGFLPGPDQERRGLARTAGKFVYELGRATTTIVNVTVRRGYGFAYIAMGGGRESNQLNLIWPTAEIAGMSIEGAVSIAYREEIEEAEDSKAKKEELIEKYKGRTGPLRATESMGVDDVIDPRNTRDMVARVLDWSQKSSNVDLPPRKHAVPPL